MNLPNKLTVARVIMVPVFVGFMSIDNAVSYMFAYAVFTVAAITDYYDGKIARDRGIVTNFGRLLDPLADKVLMASGFIMMMQVRELHVPGWTIVAIFTREFLVTGGRTIAASDGVVISASRSGKLKTIYQMVYIFVFLLLAIVLRLLEGVVTDGELMATLLVLVRQSSLIGIIFVAMYTIFSGLDFARTNWHILNLGKDV